MHSKFIKLNSCCLLGAVMLALTGEAAFARTGPSFEYRYPMVMKVASPAAPGVGGEGGDANAPVVAPTTLSLLATTLPNATVGQYYDIDFNALLTIGGDEPPSSDDISWALQGLEGFATEVIPAVNAAGILEWTPEAKGTVSFEVVAAHAGVEGRQAYTVVVNGVALKATQVVVGGSHVCALTPAGGVKCWGRDVEGQLGDGGTNTEGTTPVDVVGLDTDVVSLAAGIHHTCAVTTSGGVYCWGYDNYGQLGDGGANANQSAPSPVVGLSAGVASVSGGLYHTCAVMTSGGVKCWGRDGEGQLGDGGANADKSTPVSVVGLGATVASLASGFHHTCAVTTSGGVKCWGYDGHGQLGDGGTNTNKAAPVDVVGLGDGVVSLAAGQYHTCAVTTSGGAKCWGADGEGQLGDGGLNVDKTTPVNVSGLSTGVARLAGGFRHTCAVMAAGGAKCWGDDSNGQLGNGGTNTDNPVPADVVGLGDEVTNVAAGQYHTCAMTASGGVKCWGGDSQGQLGDGGTNTDQLAPVDVLQ